jgi:hypothetical protein
MLGNDQVRRAGACERERALLDYLWIPLPGQVRGRHDHCFCPHEQVHRPTYAQDRLAGDGPVGYTSQPVHLKRTEHGDGNVAAPDHGERLGALRKSATGSSEPLSPVGFREMLNSELRGVVRDGGHLTLLFHPFLEEQEDRFEIMRGALEELSDLAEDGVVWCASSCAETRRSHEDVQWEQGANQQVWYVYHLADAQIHRYAAQGVGLLTVEPSRL